MAMAAAVIPAFLLGQAPGASSRMGASPRKKPNVPEASPHCRLSSHSRPRPDFQTSRIPESRKKDIINSPVTMAGASQTNIQLKKNRPTVHKMPKPVNHLTLGNPFCLAAPPKDFSHGNGWGSFQAPMTRTVATSAAMKYWAAGGL